MSIVRKPPGKIRGHVTTVEIDPDLWDIIVKEEIELRSTVNNLLRKALETEAWRTVK